MVTFDKESFLDNGLGIRQMIPVNQNSRQRERNSSMFIFHSVDPGLLFRA